MYYFLCSSLPALLPDKEPGITPAQFAAACADVLPEYAARLLASVTFRLVSPEKLPGESDFPAAYREYLCFERCLRIKSAAKRAISDEARRRASLLPEPEKNYTEIDTALTAAVSARDPWEREKIVDRIRWRKLDELELQYTFSLDALCVYKLKLEILVRRFRRDTEIGKRNFEQARDAVCSAAPAAGGSEV